MISASQIRAARGFLNMGQKQIAEVVGVSPTNISEIENGATPKASTLDALQKFFELNGIEFTADGGIKPSSNIIQIYEGEDCYLRLLEDAHRVLKKGEELLKSAADERRSSSVVIAKTRVMRADGIHMRTLVRDGDTFLMGKLEEYRWMDNELFTDSDVKVIYSDRVGYLVTWLPVPRTIIIKDKTIAEEQKRYFEFVWKNSRVPDQTTATERFDDES